MLIANPTPEFLLFLPAGVRRVLYVQRTVDLPIGIYVVCTYLCSFIKNFKAVLVNVCHVYAYSYNVRWVVIHASTVGRYLI